MAGLSAAFLSGAETNGTNLDALPSCMTCCGDRLTILGLKLNLLFPPTINHHPFPGESAPRCRGTLVVLFSLVPSS